MADWIESAKTRLAAITASDALGRELNAGDAPSLDGIVDAAADDGYRLRTVMRAVILSPAFQAKSNPASGAAS